MADGFSSRRVKRARKARKVQLTPAVLEAAALQHLNRFDCTRQRLKAVLERKVAKLQKQLAAAQAEEPATTPIDPEQVDQWIAQFEEGYFDPLTNMARLSEEVGELAREINHRYGQKTKKPGEAEGDVAMEMADIIAASGDRSSWLTSDAKRASRSSRHRRSRQTLHPPAAAAHSGDIER